MPFGLPLRTRNTIVEVYGQLLFGSRFCQAFGIRLPRSTSCVDVAGERERHDVGLEAVDHRARLLARAAVRLVDGDRLALRLLPVLREERVELLVELARRVVGDVEQRRVGADAVAAPRRAQRRARPIGDEIDSRAWIILCAWLLVGELERVADEALGLAVGDVRRRCRRAAVEARCGRS